MNNNTILNKIEKHGAAKVSKYVAKKLGWKIAARTLAKVGLGVASGGVLAAAMAAWSAKDLYDIANTIQEIE